MKNLFFEFKRRNVLRVAALYLVSAWLIAQVADVVIGLGELPATVGRVVLIVLALGFPVAVAFSWMFQWTPEGIRREADSTAALPAGQPVRRGWDYVILSLLVVALVYFAANYDWRGAPVIQDASIAVLPFENRSDLPEDLYFTDGIHDDVLAQLGKISSLLVISRTSVMRYRDSGVTLPEIAQELGVATILQGGVQRSGDRVRISLQLIEAATDRHVWTETYDRALSAENLFTIQSEVATAIAGALHAQLLPRERERIGVKPTANIEAYDFYLLGRRSMESRESEDLYESAEYFKRAIDLDPRFALAYTGLAYVSGLRTFYDENAESPALLAEAGVAAGRALELDPELGDAHVAYGLVRLFLGDPPETYGPHFEKGVALAPGSADARKWYGAYLSDTNRPEEALEQLQRAVQLDPMSPILRVNLGETLWWELGRRDEALAQFERALEIDPRFFSANYAIDGTMTAAEKLEYRSRTYVKSAEYPWTIADFVQNYLALGDPTRAEQWLAEFERVHPDSGWALLLHLYLSLYLSHQTESLDWAVRALETEVSRFAVPSRTLLWHDLRRGDPGTALARYGQKYPAMLEDDPEVASFADYAIAIDLAMLLRVMGQVQKSDTLLDRSLAFMAPLPESQLWEFGIHKARVHAIRGETEAALNTLREVIDAGWYREWWLFLKQDPVFDILRDDARFQLIVDELAADMARQLAMVRQGEMSGDIRLPK